MKQDNNIENKLRWMEDNDQANLAHVDQHWQQMQSFLQPVLYSSKKYIHSKSMLSNALIALILFAGIGFIIKYETSKTEKENIPTQAGIFKSNNNKTTQSEIPTIPLEKTVTAKTSSSYNNHLRGATGNLNFSWNNSLLGMDTMQQVAEQNGNDGVIFLPKVLNDEEKDKQILLQFFNTIEKPSQHFVINNFRDTNLLCTGGTMVYIPANVFVSTGNAVASEITIEIKEFYSYQDIIGNKLSTTSNGRQLISGGMLYIAAKQNGKEVKLAETKKMTIKMPTADYNEQMQLFTGEKEVTGAGNAGHDFAYDYKDNTNVNWQPAGQFQLLARTKFFIKIFDPYGKPYVSKERNDGTTIARFVIRKDCPMSDKQVLEALRGHYGLFYNKIKLKRSWSNRPRPLFSKREWPVVGDSIMIEYTKAKQLKLASKSDIEKYEKQLLLDGEAWNEKLKKIPFYEFQISKLGFMNCDRFENDQSPGVEFTLNLGEGENTNNFFSVLAFDKYRSVVQGYCGNNKLFFKQIPENANVHLVCVGVKDGKVLSCIQSLQAGREEVNGLEFKETTPDEFKKQLALLHLK